MSRFALAIYADDVREEVGNKQSLIGIYRDKMFLPGLPTVIPKLCVSVWVRTPGAKPFKSLKIRLLANDEVLLEQPLPMTSVESSESDRVAADPIQMAQVVLLISPLKIERPTILRVRVLTEEEELKAGALSIELGEKAAVLERTHKDTDTGVKP